VYTREPDVLTPSDPSDGCLVYWTVDGDLVPAGAWQAQALVMLSDGTWHSKLVRFIVNPNLA
jgi:hypothetical protein